MQGVIQDGTCLYIHLGLEIKKARVENKKERTEGNFFIATSISKLLFGYLKLGKTLSAWVTPILVFYKDLILILFLFLF